MEKMDPDGPKWGQEDFLPTKANLAKVAGFRFLLGLRMRNPIEDEEEEAETDPVQVEQADLQEVLSGCVVPASFCRQRFVLQR